MNNFEIFSNWLDQILSREIPKGIIAFNFNIYEGSNGTYDVQIIGSEEFDEDDEDWACSDFYTSGEDVCFIKRTEEIEPWEQGVTYITRLVEQYIIEGKNANILKVARAVGVGFVDGNIDIIYRAK